MATMADERAERLASFLLEFYAKYVSVLVKPGGEHPAFVSRDTSDFGSEVDVGAVETWLEEGLVASIGELCESAILDAGVQVAARKISGEQLDIILGEVMPVIEAESQSALDNGQLRVALEKLHVVEAVCEVLTLAKEAASQNQAPTELVTAAEALLKNVLDGKDEAKQSHMEFKARVEPAKFGQLGSVPDPRVRSAIGRIDASLEALAPTPQGGGGSLSGGDVIGPAHLDLADEGTPWARLV